MKTIDLTREKRTLSELLALAKHDAVLIHLASGEDFLLEQADDFDKEVAALGASEKLMSFLQDRARERDEIPFAEVKKKRGV